MAAYPEVLLVGGAVTCIVKSPNGPEQVGECDARVTLVPKFAFAAAVHWEWDHDVTLSVVDGQVTITLSAGSHAFVHFAFAT